MTYWMALAIFGGYELFPAKRDPHERALMDVNDIIKMAERLGTLNKPDRARQYSRSDNEELLRSLNELWKSKRVLEVSLADRDKQIAELHTRLKERDELIKHQGGYLKSKDLKYRIFRVAVGLLIAAQWSVIGLLAHELLGRLGLK